MKGVLSAVVWTNGKFHEIFPNFVTRLNIVETKNKIHFDFKIIETENNGSQFSKFTKKAILKDNGFEALLAWLRR